MMKPRNSILIAGHPLVAVPMLSICVFLGGLEVIRVGFGWLTLISLVLGGWFGNCMKQAGQYRAWRRDWDSLDPDYRPPRPLRALSRLVLTAVSIAGGYWLLANYRDAASPAHLTVSFMAWALPVMAVAALVLRGRKHARGASRTWLVSQANSRPLPAPSVAEAFARLPDYCRSPARKDHA